MHKGRVAAVGKKKHNGTRVNLCALAKQMAPTQGINVVAFFGVVSQKHFFNVVR